jgi:hypothetical protein
MKDYEYLDSKGIYLDEVNKKYPRVYQTLGYDTTLEIDGYNKPKVISSFEMMINGILTLLFMKPGQFPSIPDLGIDIESYLHEYADDPSIPSTIENQLNDQCNRLQYTGLDLACYIDHTVEGVPCLVIRITGTETLARGSESNRVYIGISYDKLNQLYVRKRYDAAQEVSSSRRIR